MPRTAPNNSRLTTDRYWSGRESRPPRHRVVDSELTGHRLAFSVSGRVFLLATPPWAVFILPLISQGSLKLQISCRTKMPCGTPFSSPTSGSALYRDVFSHRKEKTGPLRAMDLKRCS